MSGLRDAVGFLTRIPVAAGGHPGSSAVPWFPLVGAGVGVFAGGLYAGSYQIMPSPLAALVAVAGGILLTGAFHEDGFADTADALGSGKAGRTALEVMRDSRLGTYGSIAVTISILWRVLAVAALDPLQAVAGLVMAHALARSATVLLMATTRPARDEGLGHSGVTMVNRVGAATAMVSGLFIAGVAGGWWLIPAVLVGAVGFVWLRQVAMTRFSGITGDVLGACEQLTELAVIAVVAVVTWGGSDPWWA